jgi:hypothetical protein
MEEVARLKGLDPLTVSEQTSTHTFKSFQILFNPKEL